MVKSITLPERLTSSNLSQLQSILVAGDDDIEIIGKSTFTIGALPALALVAFSRSVTAAGKVCQVIPSPEMLSDLTTLGLHNFLELKGMDDEAQSIGN